MKAAEMLVRMLATVLLCVGAALAHARATDVNSASSLGAKYAALRTQLSNNQFQKPLYLDSSESSDSVAGDVYAVVDHPFATTASALSGAGEWCEIIFLSINTKYCRVSAGGEGSVLDTRIGRKYDQPVDQAYRVEFFHRVVTRIPDYLQVELSADQGPLGTRNYRIVLEAIPVEKGRTFRPLFVFLRLRCDREAGDADLSRHDRAKTRWDLPSPGRSPTASRCISAACEASWSATACATTLRSRPSSGPYPRRPRRSSKNACGTGTPHRSVIRANSMRSGRRNTWK
jgi:hypothetical protein